jgi:hypothetical protein
MPRKKTQKATPAIGDHFGVSAQSAHEMVTKGLKATLAEPLPSSERLRSNASTTC